MEFEVVFFSIGIIADVGYVASNIFERTGVPDIPFLILLGILASRYVVDGTQGLELIAPYLAAVAIAVILFNGGMYLKLRQVIEDTPKGFLITSVSVVFTIAILSGVGYLINLFVLDNSWGTGREALLS